MEKLRGAVRPTDVVLAVLMSGLGVWLMVENMHSHGQATRVDSHTWLLIPVWLVATVPLLLRRVNMLAVIVVSMAAMAVHVAAFGWLVRCGAGLPLALVLAYGAGRLITPRAQGVIGLLLTIGFQILVLVRDSAAGLGVLPVTAVLGVAVWGVGVYVRSRFDASVEGATAPVPVGTRA